MSGSKLTDKQTKSKAKNDRKEDSGGYTILNHYAKSEILTHLIKEGSDETSVDKLFSKKFKFHPRNVKDFVEIHAKNSQNGVQVECNSQALQSISNWIEGFKESGLNLTAANELPLIMKAISLLEDHPSPEQCDGINFKELYAFIGCVMKGEPCLELDKNTRTFLCDVLGELVDTINNNEGDNDVMKLRDELRNPAPKETKALTLEEQLILIGLNPLMLDNLKIT